MGVWEWILCFLALVTIDAYLSKIGKARQMEADARLLEARAALAQHERSQTEG